MPPPTLPPSLASHGTSRKKHKDNNIEASHANEDESSNSSPASPKEFDDGYDENLMGDEEDKKKLAQMTEKEREQELFNRGERRETLKIRFEIERKLKKKREHEKKETSRKRLRASEIYSSDDESSEDSEYSPEIDSKSPLLISSSASNASSASSVSSSSSSSSSEQENEDDEQVVRDDFQMTLNDLRSLQLKRDRIEKWVYAPFFKETAIGLFVKISVGNHPTSIGQHLYKVAQIMDISQGPRIYAVNEGKTKTDKHCLVKIGRVERTYAMSFISNRTFDEDDFSRWIDQLDGQGMPSRDFLVRKKRDLHRANNYEYKDDDIRYEVNERTRFKDNPYNFALKKTELLGEKQDAEASNDYERARQIQALIDDLEDKAKELEKTRSSSTFSAISFVNERNRYKNIVESERVLKESKSVKTEDPFTRRKCTPTIVHAAKQNEKNGQEVSGLAIHNNNGLQIDGNKAEGVKSVDDLFQAHANIDLELDIDI